MITFPSSPADGSTYSAGGRQWTFNASIGAWEATPLQGLSAYEVWKANGNPSGTYGQYLTAITGPTGATGSTGPAGNSWPQRSFQVFLDMRGWYQTSPYIKILDMSQSPGLFTNGIQITSWVVDCSDAAPSTQLSASVYYCDALSGGAFPNNQSVAQLNLGTTNGNAGAIGLTLNIPTGKILYMMLTSDPVDSGIMWSVIVNYTLL